MAKVLIHIGYRKAASTFMKEWFNSHPQLHYINKKIAGFSKTTDFFSFIDSESSSDIKYFVLSENFTIYRGQEPTKTKENIQNYQKKSCNLLYSLFPEATILIITRAPKSAIHSEYNESIKNGGHLSYSELINSSHVYSYFECVLDYNFIIHLFYKKFGEKNVIVLPFELLIENPDAFIKHIQQSMNIDHIPPFSKHINPSLSPNELYWYLKISKLVFLLTNLFGKTGNNLYKKYCIWLEKRNLHKKRLSLSVKILTFIFGKKKEIINIPEPLVNMFKKPSEIFKSLPAYKNYLDLYCPAEND